MDTSNIYKIWGERRRLLLTTTTEIDLVYLKEDSFCSTHKHLNKINRFYLLSGKVSIETDFGTKILRADESWEVRPPSVHRFKALMPSVMIELAYVEKGTIDPLDIVRYKQGGRVVEGIELTEDELRQRGLLGI
jgi:mannose-6-phosphate isomerase-like protein (cupin superfamily)